MMPRVDLSGWPYDRPLVEQQALERAISQCVTFDQAARVTGAVLMLDLLADVLLARPPAREHWWQFWRAAAHHFRVSAQ